MKFKEFLAGGLFLSALLGCSPNNSQSAYTMPSRIVESAQEQKEEKWYKLELVMTTTSDWTDAYFTNASRCCVEHQKVEKKGEVEVSEGFLSLHKPSHNQTEVTLKATVYLQLPEQGNLKMVVERGAIGVTKVTVKAGNAVVLEAIHDKVTGGKGTNPKEFILSSEAIRKSGAVKFEVKKKHPKRVFAFYYPWYGSLDGPSKKWCHWDPKVRQYTDTPQLGFYDSYDAKILQKHIEWAKSAGIDGFVASWWGIHSFEDGSVKRLLELAEKEKFWVSIYLEKPERLKESLKYIRDTFGKSSAFLKVDDKPVIFVYTRALSNSAEAFEAAWGKTVLVIDTLDIAYSKAGGGLHTYNPVFDNVEHLRFQYQQCSFRCAQNAAIFAATVVPGYDDTFVRKPGGKRSREDGKLYDQFWEAAIASNPDWILITSWNEWHEGSEIEPSKEYGNAYLKKTAEWTKKWKK